MIGVAILLSLTGSQLLAQSSSDSIRSKYIRKYTDHLFIWPVIKRRTLTFDVSSAAQSKDNLSFKPNNSYSAGVGMYLFDVSAELTFSIPIEDKNRARYGTSGARDLSASILGSNWGVDAFVQRYQSFYLSNPLVAVPANKAYPLRPDIRLTNFGGNGIYVFNKRRFSLWSAYNFSERQLQSRGSMLLAWTVNNVNLTADSAVLSPGYQTRLRTQTNFNNVRYATFSVAPGYSYSVIWRKIFVNASLAVGPAHHWVYYVGPDNRPHYDIAINTFVDGRIAVGYNSDRWFGGITFVSQARAVKFQDISLDTQSQSFRMLVGYRVLEKGVLKKTWKEFFPASWRRYL